MGKKRIKPKHKSERKPSLQRIYSTSFPENIMNAKEKCFVPLHDYRLLEKKYLKLFERYKKETRNGD